MAKKANLNQSFVTAKPQYKKTFKKLNEKAPVGTKAAAGKIKFVGIKNLT